MGASTSKPRAQAAPTEVEVTAKRAVEVDSKDEVQAPRTSPEAPELQEYLESLGLGGDAPALADEGWTKEALIEAAASEEDTGLSEEFKGLFRSALESMSAAAQPEVHEQLHSPLSRHVGAQQQSEPKGDSCTDPGAPPSGRRSSRGSASSRLAAPRPDSPLRGVRSLGGSRDDESESGSSTARSAAAISVGATACFLVNSMFEELKKAEEKKQKAAEKKQQVCDELLLSELALPLRVPQRSRPKGDCASLPGASVHHLDGASVASEGSSIAKRSAVSMPTSGRHNCFATNVPFENAAPALGGGANDDESQTTHGESELDLLIGKLKQGEQMLVDKFKKESRSRDATVRKSHKQLLMEVLCDPTADPQLLRALLKEFPKARTDPAAAFERLQEKKKQVDEELRTPLSRHVCARQPSEPKGYSGSAPGGSRDDESESGSSAARSAATIDFGKAATNCFLTKTPFEDVENKKIITAANLTTSSQVKGPNGTVVPSAVRDVKKGEHVIVAIKFEGIHEWLTTTGDHRHDIYEPGSDAKVGTFEAIEVHSRWMRGIVCEMMGANNQRHRVETVRVSVERAPVRKVTFTDDAAAYAMLKKTTNKNTALVPISTIGEDPAWDDMAISERMERMDSLTQRWPDLAQLFADKPDIRSAILSETRIKQVNAIAKAIVLLESVEEEEVPEVVEPAVDDAPPEPAAPQQDVAQASPKLPAKKLRWADITDDASDEEEEEEVSRERIVTRLQSVQTAAAAAAPAEGGGDSGAGRAAAMKKELQDMFEKMLSSLTEVDWEEYFKDKRKPSAEAAEEEGSQPASASTPSSSSAAATETSPCTAAPRQDEKKFREGRGPRKGREVENKMKNQAGPRQ